MAHGAISPRDSISPPPQLASVPPLSPTERDRALQGLDDASAALVLRILDSATMRDLPLAPLATRVREGVRRGVPGPRIVVVVRNYAAALAGARDVLGATAGGAELQSGAEAMLAGAPAAALRQIRTARREGSVVEPLMALADLATHGVSPLRASTALAALMARGGSDAPVRTLRAEVIGDIVRGVSPDAALAGRFRSVGDEPRGAPLPLGGTRDSTPLSGGVP